MTASQWERARWVVLYILAAHGDSHLYAIQRIAQERFGIEVTPYMVGRFRRPQGIVHWPAGARLCSLTDKGRAALSL